jgi:hypothetical protein
MNAYTHSLSLLVLLLLLQACDIRAVNEPGEDIQPPTVSFITPLPTDTITDAFLPIQLSADDNDAVASIALSLNNGEPFDILTSEPWESQLPTTDLAEGTHVLQATATDRAGNVGSTTVQLRKGRVVHEHVSRMVLVEVVTSANCPPCGPANELYQQQKSTTFFQERVATIKYHVWWPRPTDKLWHHSSEWARPRVEHLFDPNEGAPMGFVDGQKINNRASDWIAAAMTAATELADARIELEEHHRDGNMIHLIISVTGISSSSFSDLRLHTVVTETDIEYNDGNSEEIHYDVMRRMYPDAGGELVSIQNGQTSVFERTIEIHEEWNPDKLSVVVFLQSRLGRQVLQAAKLHL